MRCRSHRAVGWTRSSSVSGQISQASHGAACGVEGERSCLPACASPCARRGGRARRRLPRQQEAVWCGHGRGGQHMAAAEGVVVAG